MRIEHHALSKTDMPDRRLPCPTERWTESSKRERVQSYQSAQDPFNPPKKWQLPLLNKKMKIR
jgi:hypothetical protein